MYEAEGLLFETEDEALQAKKEADGIRYLKEKTQMDDPDTILKLYHSLLEKKLFRTEVGLRFLFELQEYLQSIPYIKSEDIKPIPARRSVLRENEAMRREEKVRGAQKKTRKRMEKRRGAKEGMYRRRFHVSLFFAIVFAIVIAGMFTLVATTDAGKMINYENEIINKYEEWQQELTDWEQDLKTREEQLKGN